LCSEASLVKLLEEGVDDGLLRSGGAGEDLPEEVVVDDGIEVGPDTTVVVRAFGGVFKDSGHFVVASIRAAKTIS
jgi:hypothetical protein